jgi:GNAT superfamily N-acetyltransferase
VLAQVIAKRVPAEQATVAAMAVVKIRAVGVDERRRGLGLGSAMIRRCLQLYFQLGYHVAYGQFRTASRCTLRSVIRSKSARSNAVSAYADNCMASKTPVSIPVAAPNP